MTFQRAEQKKPHECGVARVPLQKCPEDGLEESLIIGTGGELIDLLGTRIADLACLVLQDRRVEFLLRAEMPENDGFIHAGLRRQVACRGSAKAILRKKLHGRGEDLLSSFMFHK